MLPDLEVRVRCLAVSLMALVVGFPGPAWAQVVRGTVTERGTGAPLSGVLVSAVRAGVRDTLYALTNQAGTYAIRLTGTGDWGLAFKRIGVVRRDTVLLAIGSAETRLVDVEVEALATQLPVTAVTATNLCLDHPQHLQRIIALWNEARTVLRASEVTQRDRFVQGWLSAYERELDPVSLRIFNDRRSVVQGRYDRPIRSVSPAELEATGFWGAIGGDTLVFNGPDAVVLLSELFQNRHCFRYDEGRGNRRGLLGIGFRPRQRGLTGGITGAMWVDMLTFELRFVEFYYDNLFTMPRNPHLGGEVHFAKHESGGWVVQRWHIRMPLFEEITSASSRNAPRRPQAPIVRRILEKGGSLYSTELQILEHPATVTGMVMDSTGRRPLDGALVSLSGTPFSATVDERGAFRFDSIIPGAYVLLVSQGDYANFGRLAVDQPVNLEAGRTFSVRLRAIGTDEIRRTLCANQAHEPGQSVLRILAIEADSGTALAKLRVWLRWPDPDDPTLADPINGGEQTLDGSQAETDASGYVTFCGVPSRTPVELVMLRSDDDPSNPAGARFVRVASFVLEPGVISARTVNVRRPR